MRNSDSSKSTVHTHKGRDALLEAYTREQYREKNISFKTLLWVYLALLCILSIFLLKVYISNEIYYTSKEITALYHKYTALKEENTRLRMELEQNEYQNQVLDTIE